MKNKRLWNSMCALSMSAVLGLTGAGCVYGGENDTAENQAEEAIQTTEVMITLSDDGITVDGEAVSTDSTAAVYTGAEIVYYQEGQGTTYGAGDAEDEHSAEEAAAHTVVTIAQPGTYRVTGSISQGQIAVDLGEEAEEDANAVVNLILDNVDITCTVASGIAVFNAYECGSDDMETATKDVDTKGQKGSAYPTGPCPSGKTAAVRRTSPFCPRSQAHWAQISKRFSAATSSRRIRTEAT